MSRRTGPKSLRWNGGKYVSPHGYVLLHVGRAASSTGYVFEHRAIMERAIGRRLRRNEVVHHKNGIRADNRLSNLEIMEKRAHDHHETTKRWREGTMRR